MRKVVLFSSGVGYCEHAGSVRVLTVLHAAGDARDDARASVTGRPCGAGEVGTGAGDVAGGADYRPTDAQQVFAEIQRDLAVAKTGFDTLMKTTLPEFNRTMAGKLVPITDERPKPKPVVVGPLP